MLLLLSIVYFAVDDQLFEKDLYIKKPLEGLLPDHKISQSIAEDKEKVSIGGNSNKLIIEDNKNTNSNNLEVNPSKNPGEIKINEDSKDKDGKPLDESIFEPQTADEKETVFKRFCDILKVPVSEY